MDILPGQLAFIIVVGTVDAALLGWLTLRWYQRAVTRVMAERAQRHTQGHRGGAVPPPSPMDAGDSVGAPPAEAARQGCRNDTGSSRRVALAYLIGALLFSTIISGGMIVEMGAANPAIVATWLWIFAWPIVPSIGLLLVFDHRRTLLVATCYLATGALAIAGVTLVAQALSDAVDDAPLTNIYVATTTSLVTIYAGVALVALTAWRPVRLVMPLALATSLTFGLALLITPRLVAPAFEVAGIRDAVLAAPTLASGVPLYYAIVLLVALPLGWIGWRVLNGLAAAFAAKRFSDAQLVVDCWWAIVAAEVTATYLVPAFGTGGLAVGAAAFLVYRCGVSVVLRATAASERYAAGRLLLLRVFGYQARTETLFDGIAQRWRLRGPVHLIGAADLARRTTDPGDVLAFVDGRLAEQFVTSHDDIPRRLATLDMSADPDGRFRVNEIYCHEGVWRETLLALLRVTDVVVMDLRQFGRVNRGCIFELEQVFTRLPSWRVVLICDSTTDRELLREVMTGTRPGAASASAEGSIVNLERNSSRELDVVLQRLVRATAAAVPA